MANKRADSANSRKLQAQYNAWKNRPKKDDEVVLAPGGTGSGWSGLQGGGGGDTSWSDGGGGGGGGGGISAAESAARKVAKDQAAKENANTQAIINMLRGSLAGYAAGRDTQLANAESVFTQALAGIGKQYQLNSDDLGSQAARNESDEAAKTFSNRTNRSRERQALLEQAASQGAGETDQLRTIVQAFENADANQQEVTTAYNDSLGSIRSSLTGINASTENARRNAWGQREDARSQAMNDYYKNYMQTWTDIQRTAASNSNIDSDYSVGFNADFGGLDPVAEAARYAGTTRKFEAPDEEFTSMWDGKRDTIGKETTPTKLAAMTRLGPVKKAEGSDLRKWTT